jgi:hypothetical protein
MGDRFVSQGELVHPEARAELQALNARLAPSLGFYSVILLLALVAPAAAAFGFLAIALVAVIRS